MVGTRRCQQEGFFLVGIKRRGETRKSQLDNAFCFDFDFEVLLDRCVFDMAFPRNARCVTSGRLTPLVPDRFFLVTSLGTQSQNRKVLE